jgi:hypothetical protein
MTRRQREGVHEARSAIHGSPAITRGPGANRVSADLDHIPSHAEHTIGITSFSTLIAHETTPAPPSRPFSLTCGDRAPRGSGSARSH